MVHAAGSRWVMIVALVLSGCGVGALANSSAETLKFQNIAQNKTKRSPLAARM